uniref:YbaK/aminoacyl-tRNA synthetase-associated domain-containing protein n=1 Tax=Salix viminalis TaxID=40686 RepID=A0A6N2MAE9_SALVM
MNHKVVPRQLSSQLNLVSYFLFSAHYSHTMGFTKEELLARLKELQIDFSQYEHPTVLTVEEQAKYVGDKGGGLSKNLFLKDKKSRFYIVSALADTKFCLKGLVWGKEV